MTTKEKPTHSDSHICEILYQDFPDIWNMIHEYLDNQQ